MLCSGKTAFIYSSVMFTDALGGKAGSPASEAGNG